SPGSAAGSARTAIPRLFAIPLFPSGRDRRVATTIRPSGATATVASVGALPWPASDEPYPMSNTSPPTNAGRRTPSGESRAADPRPVPAERRIGGPVGIQPHDGRVIGGVVPEVDHAARDEDLPVGGDRHPARAACLEVRPERVTQ